MEHRIIKNETEPFRTPDNYFDSFESRLMSRIHAEESKPRKLWLRNASIAAACAAIIVICSLLLLNTQSSINQKTEQIISAETSTDDAYYDEINSELSSAEIEEALAQINYEDETEN